ncbi:uncharacterized protein PRCAT00005309001 [Priceomyces carsonii]|uniref:uncharacterized protein n=1 Tax=Priceomyces carsonii TaxID=28549 RepID=UPI002ED89D38|nr:unnamed protein product [Priceomyces carsonii]
MMQSDDHQEEKWGSNDYDMEDEVQDWKHLSNMMDKGQSLPKRGEKDFEPDGTDVQANLLEESRNSMYSVLDEQRCHHAKQKLISVWIPLESRSIVPQVKGNFFRDIGEPLRLSHKNMNGVYLNPIETVYLVERGSMSIYLGDELFDEFLKNDSSDFNYETLKPLSLSHLYSLAFDRNPEWMDHLHVFSYLKRHGYLVRDFKRLNESSQADRYRAMTQVKSLAFISSLFKGTLYYFQNKCFRFLLNGLRKFGILSQGTSHHLHYTTKHYFNYTSVFESLRMVTSYSTYDSLSSGQKKKEHEYNIAYNVWKPTPKFSKKDPPMPDFQICIVNTDKVSFPTLETIQALFNEINHLLPYEKMPEKDSFVKKKKKKVTDLPTRKEIRFQKRQDYQKKLDPKVQKRNTYLKLRDQKLRNGVSGRSFVIATISNGVLNFTHLCEADFTLRGAQVDDLNEMYNKKEHGLIWLENV